MKKNVLTGLLVLTAAGLLAAELTYEQQACVPAWVQQRFSQDELGKKYAFSNRLNPLYLRGDFDGDGQFDVAVLVEEKDTGKNGFVVLHRAGDQHFVVGAGRELGNGGDDFQWMNAWQVREKEPLEQGADERVPPALKGETIRVEKLESASALVYWTGKGYAWHQQGD